MLTRPLRAASPPRRRRHTRVAAVSPGATQRRRQPCNGGQPVRTCPGAAVRSAPAVDPPAPGRVRAMPSAASHRPAALCARLPPCGGRRLFRHRSIAPVHRVSLRFACYVPRGEASTSRKPAVSDCSRDDRLRARAVPLLLAPVPERPARPPHACRAIRRQHAPDYGGQP